MQHKEQLKSQAVRLRDTVTYLTTTASGFPNFQVQLLLLAQPPPHPAWFQELRDNRQQNLVLLGKAFARRNFLFVYNSSWVWVPWGKGAARGQGGGEAVPKRTVVRQPGFCQHSLGAGQAVSLGGGRASLSLALIPRGICQSSPVWNFTLLFQCNSDLDLNGIGNPRP